MTTDFNLPPVLYEDFIRSALREDLGRAGDITSDAIVSATSHSRAAIVARREGRIAGAELAVRTFQLFEPGVAADLRLDDGEDASDGAVIAFIEGPARAILSAERTALNVLGHLSGIATLTRSYVAAVRGTGARVACTRKTTPGLRALEKYAVRCGGGVNHRFGLDDAVLIKDNHIVVAGGVRQAIEKVRASIGHMVKIELEVDTIEQLEEGLGVGVDAVLLDNMDTTTLAQAVSIVAGRCITEASGGIDLETASSVAATGVDILSVGALTHSAPALDVALEIAS